MHTTCVNLILVYQCESLFLPCYHDSRDCSYDPPFEPFHAVYNILMSDRVPEIATGNAPEMHS